MGYRMAQEHIDNLKSMITNSLYQVRTHPDLTQEADSIIESTEEIMSKFTDYYNSSPSMTLVAVQKLKMLSELLLARYEFRIQNTIVEELFREPLQ
jgi:hypothetical protein